MTTLGCFVHVVDPTGKMLLVHQAYGKQLWTTPGGRVEPGESPIDAAVREADEETGLAIEVTGFLGVYSKPYGDDVVIGVYGAVVGCRYEWKPNEEIAGLGWFALGELPAAMSFNTRVRVLDAFARKSALLRVFDTPESQSASSPCHGSV
jgi:8-oxo-dGTP diphosphatase